MRLRKCAAPNLAIQFFHFDAFGHPRTAVHLHRRVDDPLRAFGRVELGHRGGAAIVGAADVLLPRGAINQQCRRIDRRRHVGELRLSHCIVGEFGAAEPAIGRERDRFVERPPGKAERCRADRYPKQVQSLHADAEAFAGFADQRVGGNPHVVVLKARERVRSDHLDALGDAEPAASAGTMKALTGRASPRLRRCARRSRRNRRCRRSRCRSFRRPEPTRFRPAWPR